MAPVLTITAATATTTRAATVVIVTAGSPAGAVRRNGRPALVDIRVEDADATPRVVVPLRAAAVAGWVGG
jgi:hypothetical protein